jgi:DNA-directed RNA polymerase specialized sigma24 family protein
VTADVERDSGSSGRSRGLTNRALDALLERLQAEGPSPQVVYETLRKRLIAYLRLHVPAQAETLADEALDRMARRMHEGTPVQNVYLYALGIARLLVRESRARTTREDAAARDATLFQDDADDVVAREALDAALRACMEALPPGGAGLIVEYYSSGEGAARIESRRHIAARLGLGLNALRNRALRLRDMLESCIRQRTAPRDGSPLPDTEDE